MEIFNIFKVILILMRKPYLMAIIGVVFAAAALLLLLDTYYSSKFNECNSDLIDLYDSKSDAYVNWERLHGDMTYYHVLATEYLLMNHIMANDSDESNYFNSFKNYRSKQREQWDPIADLNNQVMDINREIRDKRKECNSYLLKSEGFTQFTLFLYILILILSVIVLKKSRK